MAKAWLALGANLGEPQAQLDDAISRIAAHPEMDVVLTSGMIVTKAWGKTDQPDFINMAVEIATSLPPGALLDACLGIEKEMGRVRDARWGPRLIDIDIIAYEKLVLSTGRLTLPHPHAHMRGFVLGPLREIAPDTADWLVAQANARRSVD